MKKIVLTGGGTAGHVTPHLSLIPRLKEAGYEIHYIGTENGIEHQMIAAIPGITYHSVKSGKLRRYFSLQNFSDPFKVVAGAAESVALMRKIKPDVVFSKGGFVSVPVVVGAWMCHVPTVCHESDLTPGLANRICAKFAWRVAATFPECAKALGEKGVMTGTPLRPELFRGSRAAGLIVPGVTAPGTTFTDVKNHVNKAAIEELASRGIINGMGKGTFMPNKTMTRAEFAAIVTRALGLAAKDTKAFTDVPSSKWYAGYIGTANSSGIVNGVGSGKFNPDGTITRQEAAAMVARAAKLCGLDTAMDAAATKDMLAQFGDYRSVASWAKEPIAFCYSVNILDQSDLNIEPTKAILRCEIAQMLYNMLTAAELI